DCVRVSGHGAGSGGGERPLAALAHYAAADHLLVGDGHALRPPVLDIPALHEEAGQGGVVEVAAAGPVQTLHPGGQRGPGPGEDPGGMWMRAGRRRCTHESSLRGRAGRGPPLGEVRGGRGRLAVCVVVISWPSPPPPRSPPAPPGTPRPTGPAPPTAPVRATAVRTRRPQTPRRR